MNKQLHTECEIYCRTTGLESTKRQCNSKKLGACSEVKGNTDVQQSNEMGEF